MVWAQNQAIELKKLLANFDEQAKKAKTELKKRNEDVARLETKVAELEKQWALVKKSIIEEFKSSDDFQEAVVISASAYFGEGFNFYKRQLAHHHPNLDIDLDIMEMDRNLLEKKEAEVEERKDKENEGEEEKEKGDTNPLSL